MTTANKLTLVRIALVPVFILLMSLEGTGSAIAALVIFIIASATDLADGYIARKYHQVTDFGKFADPLADKILIISAVVIFVQRGQMPSWCAIIIIAREFAVTGLRLIAVENGIVIAAGISGKIKTFASDVGCCLMITPWHADALLGCGWLTIDNLCVAVMVILTLWSGCEYFIHNAHVLKGAK